MLNSLELKTQIKTNLNSFLYGDLQQNALQLLETLGYESDKRIQLSPNTAEGFKNFLIENGVRLNNEKKAHFEEWKKVEFLFQLTSEEINLNKGLYDSIDVDVSDTRIESYIFLAIELKNSTYRRSQLAEITREINRNFPMPVMILFKHGNTITFSIIDRRQNKKDDQKDVLQKVTLIKDIRLENPHHAHILILADLALNNLNVRNYDELHKAWQKVLDTKELNKKFFQELANWYFWAVENVTFPSDEEKNDEVRNATSVIRLITRLMFVWFLKEKGLVSEKLFDEKYLKTILRFQDESTFYKAILQNLFFATLNSEMGTRKFIAESSGGRSSQHFVHNVFRYKREFTKPEETIKELFEPIPFLNGGLFECLDKEIEVEGTNKRIRVDGFSDHPKNVLSFPDKLFFSDADFVDLSSVFDDKKKTNVKVCGLINILNSYKFTIAENTPIEEEIALDPELLGKVFENLLASYNPETKTTARKQTGSFYTPREIVNYMVDESLIAYLKSQLQTETEGFAGFVAFGETQPTMFGNEARIQPKFEMSVSNNRWHGKDEELENALRDLFQYTEEGHQFNEVETEILIKAIDKCKILDPACGSGAFPMGILHRLVHLLKKLDKNNEKWREWQRQKAIKETEEAFKIGDKKERDERLLEINDVFENNASDYGRKLFLIENCIYGVDIQPIAIQIAKLRFFISLIVDEKINRENENLGIRPLPNLETKFVAANTLIGLETQGGLKPEKVNELEKQLKEVRAKHFSARTRRTKENYRNKDKKVRLEIADLLKQGGIKADIADQIANWNPYDQNASADWFNAEYMFGIDKGFDIVIGNPPYVRIQEIEPNFASFLKSNYVSATGKFDIYVNFIEFGAKHLNSIGILSFINPNKFFNSTYGLGIRKLITNEKSIWKIIDFGDAQVFENATTYTCLIFISKKRNETLKYVSIYSENDFTLLHLGQLSFQSHKLQKGSDNWSFSTTNENSIWERFKKLATLKDYCNEIFQGLISGSDKLFFLEFVAENDKFITAKSTINNMLFDFEKELCFRLLKGAEIKRYSQPQNKFVAIFPYVLNDFGQTTLISEITLRTKYPKTYEYFSTFKRELSSRGSERMEYESWYAMWCPRTLEKFTANKIITQVLASSANYTVDYTGKTLFVGGGNAGGYGIIPKDENNLLFLLGLLNSRLLDFYLQKHSSRFRGGFYSYARRFIQNCPIAKANEPEKNHISEIVSEIIEVKKYDTKADTRNLEFKIDTLVYQLYGLTDEEIQIVEGKESDC